jgi:hypothetical protein
LVVVIGLGYPCFVLSSGQVLGRRPAGRCALPGAPGRYGKK